jgi:ketosteroid isomerase-like protein
MMSAKNIAVVLIMLSSCVLGQNGRSPDRTDDQTEILKAIAEVSHAYVARNPEPFSRIYLENYVSIRGKPVFNTREQLIAMMKADSGPVRAGKKLDFETLTYESENPQFHFFGGSAIVNIAKKNLWQYRGDKCLTKTQATELWIKTDGTWRIAAGHVTSFHCSPKPFYPIHPAVSAIRSVIKAPPNSDQQAEADIRSVVGEILAAGKTGADLASVISKHVVEKFVSTDLEGKISNDPAELAKLPPAITSRIPGLRNREETVTIYGDAAIYTYRARPPASPGGPTREPSQQCTLFLVNTGQKWRIAAMHVSDLITD